MFFLILYFEFYLNYKSVIILKGLIGILLIGVVFFVFVLYIGFISDCEIIWRLGLVELLELNDGVMVDKGFIIEDILILRNCILNIFLFFREKF